MLFDFRLACLCAITLSAGGFIFSGSETLREAFEDENTLIISADGAAGKDPKRAVPVEILKERAFMAARIDAYVKIARYLLPPKEQKKKSVTTDFHYTGFMAMEIISRKDIPDGENWATKIQVRVRTPGLKQNGLKESIASGKDIKISVIVAAPVTGDKIKAEKESLLGAFCESLNRIAEWRSVALHAVIANDGMGTSASIEINSDVAGLKISGASGIDNYLSTGVASSCSRDTMVIGNDSFISTGYASTDPTEEAFILKKTRAAKNLSYSANLKIESVTTRCAKDYCITTMRVHWREP